MNAALTGATGFVGRALLHRLVPQCGSVRALVRQTEQAETVYERGATPVRGDLTDPHGCAELVQPGDVVFHCAARVDLIGTWAEFVRTTIDGTRNLLATALPRQPARFVYVSSAGVYLGRAQTGPVAADRTRPDPYRFHFYGRAKLAAEQLVQQQCERAGCPWVIVRLGFLYGPGNRALVRHMVPMLKSRRLYVIGRGDNRIATLYIDDAVDALVLAGAHPAASGRIYDVASVERVTQQEYLDQSADALGLPRTRRKVPYVVARAAATLCEAWARFVHRPPAFTRAMVALLAADQVVDSSAIGRELGWEARTRFADGIQRMRQWYAQVEDAG